MVLWRLLGGLGLGFMLTTVPVYLSELSPPQFRGAAVACFQVANNTGILLCAAFNVWAADHFNGWRYALGLQAGPAAVVAACVGLLLPESPRYLARCGADDRALRVLTQLCAGSEKASELAASELGDIKAELAELEAAGSLSWRELFRGSALTSLLCGVGICMTQNITCICYFINFSPVIISNLCLSPWVGSIGLNGVNLLASILSVFVVDRLGRKVVLMWGTYVICAAFLVNATLFTAVPDLLENRPVALFMLAWVFVFMAAFGLSWGPCGWVVPSEVFPLNVRGKGMALATTFNMLASILFGDFGPNFVSSPDVLGVTGAWWLMTAIVFFWVLPVVTLILPETRGLTLEQMTGAFAYCYGGDGKNNLGTMTAFFRSNAREAWEVSCPGRALLRKS
jgi:sugar porter (SP) family MFS transporter